METYSIVSNQRVPSEQVGATDVRVESCVRNSDWDRFLEGSPLGQYQQSSLWADYKQSDGWRPCRILVRDASGIAGGLQVLWAPRRPGRIGYVTKGPVVGPSRGNLNAVLLDLLLQTARDLRLRALIVQPPDSSTLGDDMLSTRGFVPETLLEIIRNNLVVDVSRGMEVVEAGMTRSMRKRLRQAKARGCIVREASRSDLPRFFELMSATCRRQGERSPNPESVTQLAALWDAFQPSGRLRITLCEIGGRAVAGLLCLRWGGRMTLWKKGWDETHGDARPNEILYGESFEWAIGQGIKSCDFGALNPTDAGRLLSGQALCDDSHRGRDYFNLSFGGSAVRLPEAMIWFDRPWWRWGYAAAGWLAQVRRFLRTGTLASPAHSNSTESVQAVGSSPN